MIKKFFNRTISRKVPEVILLFWIIKLLTTALGESTSDFMVHNLDPIIAVMIGAIAFLIALIIQLRARTYSAWIYWLTVTMVAIFGTMAADVLHIGLGIPYFVSTIFFAVCLVIVFSVWYKGEGTLSIHSISTPRRELFYWATVITTFALGTAAGDMTAVTFKLGYLDSGILFAILFIVPLIAYKSFKANEVVTFWFAYIMTRPFGASFADWFGRTPDTGGIGFGTGKTSLVLTVLLIIFVTYLAKSRIDSKKAS